MEWDEDLERWVEAVMRSPAHHPITMFPLHLAQFKCPRTAGYEMWWYPSVLSFDVVSFSHSLLLPPAHVLSSGKCDRKADISRLPLSKCLTFFLQLFGSAGHFGAPAWEVDDDRGVDLDQEALLRCSLKGIKPLVRILRLEKSCRHLYGFYLASYYETQALA